MIEGKPLWAVLDKETFEQIKRLCPHDYDSCSPCTYHHVYGCPCRGETKETQLIIANSCPALKQEAK